MDATVARAPFSNVTAEAIPDAGHGLMEEQSQAVIRAVPTLLDNPLPSRGGWQRPGPVHIWISE